MKKKCIPIMIIFCSLFFCGCNCSLGDSENIFPTITRNGEKYIDYGKYIDNETLEKIKFGKVNSSEFYEVSGSFNGYLWKYTNDLNDQILVQYNPSNPEKYLIFTIQDFLKIEQLRRC